MLFLQNRSFFLIFLLNVMALTGCRDMAVDNYTDDSADSPADVLTREKWIDSEGWTSFTPSPDARIVYVAESGDDDTARIYSPDDLGDDPFEPTGTVMAYASYEAAFGQLRSGYGDWMLFKRGDTFRASLSPLSGLSPDYPALIGSYGSSGVLPLIQPVVNDREDTEKIEMDTCIALFCRRGTNCINSVITALDFYCPEKDPALGTPVNTSVGGIGIMALGSGGEQGIIRNLLIEGCRFRFFDNNTIQKLDEGIVENIIIKRCQILDNYKYTTDNGHSQGLYASYIDGLYFIENVFDHNGWLNQAPDDSDTEVIGRGTIFNHNTYLTDCTNVEFYHNISLRPSSIHHKFTAQGGEGSASNIQLGENLLVDGEVGISLGGNDQSPYRFKDILINGNLITEQGRSIPTNRYIGWGIDVQDWDGGMVVNNILACFYDQGDNNNNYGFSFNGGFKNIRVKGNTVWKVYGNGMTIYDRDGGYREDNWFYENRIEADDPERSWTKVLRVYDDEGLSIARNTYNSTTNEKPFILIDESLSFADWVDHTGDVISQFTTDDFIDPMKSIALYNSTQAGGDNSIDAFIEGCRSQSRYNWNSDYTAESVIDWFRE